jgi:hypothetical protein
MMGLYDGIAERDEIDGSTEMGASLKGLKYIIEFLMWQHCHTYSMQKLCQKQKTCQIKKRKKAAK